SDSEVDNPFRPDGELSKEADTIVSLIKEGKPITPVKGEGASFPDGGANGEPKVSPVRAPGPLAAERRPDTNGAASLKKGVVEVGALCPYYISHIENIRGDNWGRGSALMAVLCPQVQHGIVVPPSDSSTVEQVMIKKKPKCKCCVIQ
ncbi:unnamed protein product, partial [Ixodes hexagonus]